MKVWKKGIPEKLQYFNFNTVFLFKCYKISKIVMYNLNVNCYNKYCKYSYGMIMNFIV